jgi:hypothetical protein
VVADPYEQHRAILAAAQELLAGVLRTPRISMQELSRLRNRLASLIRAHRRTEEEQIFGPLFRSGKHEQLPGLMADLQQSQAQKSLYSANIRHWSPQAIEADWPAYAATVAERVRGLEDMIRFEEDRIYRPVLEYLAQAVPESIRAAG